MAYLPYELVLAGFLNHQRRIMIRNRLGRLVFSGYDFFSAVDDAWLRIRQGEVVELVLPCKGCLVGFIGGWRWWKERFLPFQVPNITVWNRPTMFKRPLGSLGTSKEVCEQPKPKYFNKLNLSTILSWKVPSHFSRRILLDTLQKKNLWVLRGHPGRFFRKRRYDSSPKCWSEDLRSFCGFFDSRISTVGDVEGFHNFWYVCMCS